MKMLLAFCALIAVSNAIKATGELTTSGISSGGYFAVQFHTAFSSEVKGVGIFAAGPYMCALGDMNKALMNCMSMPASINIADQKAKISKFETAKKIDPVSNLQGSKVFIFSGKKDTTVKPEVV